MWFCVSNGKSVHGIFAPFTPTRPRAPHAVIHYFWERILSGTKPARWGKASYMWGICMACMNSS